MKKPKEWWLPKNYQEDSAASREECKHLGHIKVIEKSAFDKSEEIRSELTLENVVLKKRIKELEADYGWLNQSHKLAKVLIEHLEPEIGAMARSRSLTHHRVKMCQSLITTWREQVLRAWSYGSYGLGECHVPDNKEI